MTQPSALEIAVAFLDSWTEGDLDAAGALLADDFAFQGPVAQYASAAAFLAGSRRFVELLQPGWSRVAAFGDDREALLLYDLTLRSGAPMRIADHYVVRDGRIAAETILWDTYRSPFRPRG